MKKLKIMNRLILLLAVFVASNVSALTSAIPDDSKRSSLKTVEQLNFEAILFEAPETTYDILDVNDIEVVEVEEEVDLGFDPKEYLPEGFNALEGKDDLDWNTIELIEVEEEVDLGFDTEQYLPEGFNALEGKDDLDWSTIELIELEEEVDLGFDPKKYLPKGFNPFKGMECEKDVVVCLY